jgi:hypothetical protein
MRLNSWTLQSGSEHLFPMSCIHLLVISPCFLPIKANLHIIHPPTLHTLIHSYCTLSQKRKSQLKSNKAKIVPFNSGTIPNISEDIFTFYIIRELFPRIAGNFPFSSFLPQITLLWEIVLCTDGDRRFVAKFPELEEAVVVQWL